MSGRIVLLTASHLCNNPRAVKEADALAAAGFEVEVLGWIADAGHLEEDRQILKGRRWRWTPVVNLLDAGLDARMRHALWKIERKFANVVAAELKRSSAAQLGGWRRQLLATARTRQADLFIAHSALTIWAGVQLLREGRRVGVDMEDWFSKEHDPPYPSDLVAAGEAELLRATRHATCPSRAMSSAIASAHRCLTPVVVYNAFPWAERSRLDERAKDRIEHRRVSIHWYSQTLGRGRGLEDLFTAMPQIASNVEVHLRGVLAPGARAWFESNIPDGWRDRVYFHAPVPNAELLSRIAEHDIGYAGDPTLPPSRDLSITNKLLHYLLAGLAVVASRTQGQTEVARLVEGGLSLYRPGDHGSLAASINELARSPGLLDRAKQSSLRAARDHFSWEHVAPHLVESVTNAIAAPVARSAGQ